MIKTTPIDVVCQPAGSKPVAYRRAFQGKPLGLIFIAQFGRRHIKEQDFKTGIGQMSRYGCPHDTRTEHRCTLNPHFLPRNDRVAAET